MMPAPARVFLWLLAAGAVAYCAIGLGLFLAQRSILFRPDTARPDVAAVGVAGLESATLRSGDGLDLLAWWLPPPSGDRPVVLYFHGNGGNLADRSGRLREFAAAGFGVLMPEYPGYGGNPGAPNQRSLFAAASAALFFLELRHVSHGRIAVYGESLGTGVAAWLAVGRPFRALVLESPFTSVVALAAERYGFLPVRWLVRDPFETIGRVGRIDSPLLVAIGARDLVVPPAMGRAVFAAAPEPKRLFVAEAGGHEDLARFGLMAAVVGFVEGAEVRGRR